MVLRITLTQLHWHALAHLRIKALSMEAGCKSRPAEPSCEALLHHGDANGRSIYHVMAKEVGICFMLHVHV